MSYPAVLPTILDQVGGRPLGSTFTAAELADVTGRNFAQIRQSISHATMTGRIVATSLLGEETAWVWGGLGPNAKKADHVRIATAKAKALDSGEKTVRAMAEPIVIGPPSTGQNPHPSDLAIAARELQIQARREDVGGSALFESVRALKDGAVLLEDETGDLWIARRLDAR